MAEEVEMTPVDANDAPPKAAPFAAATPAAGGSTIKLKPVIRKPVIRAPGTAAPVPPPAPAAAKKATANLKSLTSPIPAQAVLKKTGIVAEGIITPAQQQAAKSKTSRISLESAMGVAPVKETPAPLKTIRLRRPTDLKPPSLKPAPLSPVTPAPAPAPLAAAKTDDVPALDEAPTLQTIAPLEPVAEEQKKTLKLHRPGVTLTPPKRPSLGIPPANGAVADLPGGVADLSPLGPIVEGGDGKSVKALPSWLVTITSLAALAALVVLGFGTFKLYSEACGPDAGPNALASYDF